MLITEQLEITTRIFNSLPEELQNRFRIFKKSQKKYEWSPVVIEKLELTKCENEVAKLMLRGLSNQEMAEQLFVTKAAIKWHINNIFKKAKVKNKWQFLIAYTPKKETHE